MLQAKDGVKSQKANDLLSPLAGCFLRIRTKKEVFSSRLEEMSKIWSRRGSLLYPLRNLYHLNVGARFSIVRLGMSLGYQQSWGTESEIIMLSSI